MIPEIGRFFDAWDLDTQKLLKRLYDLATGAGPDVEVAVDGAELRFRREGADGEGFFRVAALGGAVSVRFPKAQALYDPSRRATGATERPRPISIRDQGDLDAYVLRLLHEAYELDAPPAPAAYDPWDF